MTKELKKALNEAYKKAGDNAYFGNGFYAGYEHAMRWIPITEDLPENFTIVLVKDNRDNPIRTTALFIEDKFHPDFLLKGEQVTHWRKI
jgi:hypothetical protein